MHRSIVWFLLLGSVPALHAAEPVPDALHRYVAREEPAFDWHLAQTHETKAGVVHELHLVSQTWQNIVWEHALLVYEPQRLDHPNHILLMVTGGRNGGRPREQDMEMGLALAKLCGARVATGYCTPGPV